MSKIVAITGFCILYLPLAWVFGSFLGQRLKGQSTEAYPIIRAVEGE